METATIKDIDKDELVALIESFPNLWNKDKLRLDFGLTRLLHKQVESDEVFFAVHIFTVVGGLLTVFVEFQKKSCKAVFEIHGYSISSEGRHQFAEQKLRDIILGHAGEPFSKLSAIFKDRIFECPNCKAKYALWTMRISSDERIECQNCGRLVPFEMED